MSQIKQNAFLSKSIYEEVIGENNFFRRLNEIIDWDSLAQPLEYLYTNQKGGNSNWPIVMMLKLLFVQRIYNTSDRKTEALCTQDIFVKYFVGIEIQAKGPDHSAISRFRNGILKKKGLQFYENMFNDILVIIMEKGMKIGTSYAVDSTITDADVNTYKDSERKDDGDDPRDPDASWTAKSRPTKNSGSNSETKFQKKFYYGYKTHAMVDIQSDIITSVIGTPANTADISELMPLVKKSLGMDIDSISADKGYDDAVSIKILEDQYNIFPAIKVKKTRTRSGDLKQVDHWSEYISNPERQELIRQRGRCEKIFADMKLNHGLDRAKYLGLTKYQLQMYMSSIVHNLKRTLQDLYGARLYQV